MGDVRRIIAEPLESRFEPGEHAIEGVDVVAHLQRCVIDGEAFVQLPCRQPAGGFGDPAQGGQAAVRGKPAEQRRRQCRGDDARPGRMAHRREEMDVMRQIEGDQRLDRLRRRPGARQRDADLDPAMRALFDRPVRHVFGKALSRPLGCGEVLGMDDVEDAPFEVAKQDTHALMADEGAFERLEAFRVRPIRGIGLQRVADERDLALQLVHVQLLEMRVQHTAEEERHQHQQAGSEGGEQRRQARCERMDANHRQPGSIASST